MKANLQKIAIHMSKVGIFVMILYQSLTMTFATEIVAQQKYLYEINIELSEHRGPRLLLDVIKEIEASTNFKFAYFRSEIKKKKVTLRSGEWNMRDILKDISLQAKVSFKRVNENIGLTVAERSVRFPEVLDMVIQPIKVSGIVTDENGQSLPGATIVEKGTNNGTITDVDGNFSLEVAEDAILLISFVGYFQTEVSVEGRSIINVSLQPDISALEEVVIVGYGKQRKSQSTSSIATLDGEEVASRPVVNLSNNLAGRLAGVIATQGNGEPGFDGSTINIRGISTNGNNSPLLIVDGIYRDFSKLDPATIESITILKDAAAVAPYGLGGANGVVLVTTKKGKSGKATLSYNSYVGFQNPTRVTPMANSVQYALMRNEAAYNEGKELPFTDEQIAGYQRTVDGEAIGVEQDLYPNSNALEELIQENALMTYNNIELSGGTENVRYIASLGYTTQQAQWESTSIKKYNVMMGMDADVTKSTTVSLKINGWVQNSEYPGSSASGLMYRAFRVPPTVANYYSNGLWGQYTGGSVIGLAYHSGYDRIQENNILSNFSIEQRLPFLKGFSIKAQVSYDPYSRFAKTWRTPIPVYTLNTSTEPYTYDLGYQGPAKANLSQSYNQDKPLTYQGYLTYENTFGNHFISALGVVEARNKVYNNFNASIINFNSTIDELSTGSSAKEDFSIGGSSSTEKQFGYVYRLGYSFDNRYLVEVSGRYDGHYSFAPGHRYSFFPAYSVGWNVGEEDFMKSLPIINTLKIRGSYGKSGNLPNAGAFQYLSSYTLYSGAYNFGNTPGQGLSETLQGNPDITWEKSTKYDIGLEVSLFDGLVSLEADVFKEHRTDMLMGQGNSVPAEYGVALGQANLGEMDNRGFEASFGLQRSFNNDLQVGVFGNFTYVKNKMIEILETGATYDNPNRRRTGRSLGTQFGYKALGYFTSDDFNPDGSLKEGIPVQPWGAVQPGDLKYADLSGPEGVPDGIINSDDETVIGRPSTPQLMFGLTPTIAFRGFDLDMLFQGAAQNDLFLSATLAHPFDGSASATELQYKDHWTPANTDALYPRLTTAPTANNQQVSSWWIRDGRYVRLKSMQLGYTLPQGLLEKLRVVDYMRFFVSGQNLFTWTPKMDEVLDPEGTGNGQYYFQQRVVSVGTNIKF